MGRTKRSTSSPSETSSSEVRRRRRRRREERKKRKERRKSSSHSGSGSSRRSRHRHRDRRHRGGSDDHTTSKATESQAPTYPDTAAATSGYGGEYGAGGYGGEYGAGGYGGEYGAGGYGGEYGAGGYGDAGGHSGGGYGGYGGEYAGGRREYGVGWEASEGFGLSTINWEGESLVKFVKNFYHEHPAVSQMTREEVEAVLRKNNITVLRGQRKCPRPVPTFQHGGFDRSLLDLLMSKFSLPTPIQVQAWPIALSGFDMIGIAETGSGKTLAFLCPAFVHIRAQPTVSPGQGPVCLVIAPTRELVVQTHEQAVEFGRPMGIASCCVIGGEMSKRNQTSSLKNGPHIVVASPGRLCDHLRDANTNLKRVTYFVCDEADRLLDMGFKPQLQDINSQIRPDRQTLMFSATWPQAVKQMASSFLNDPVHIAVGYKEDDAYKVVLKIRQQFHQVPGRQQKLMHLRDMLSDPEMRSKRVLIFSNTKAEVDSLVGDLRSFGLTPVGMHGDKSQTERTQALSYFNKGTNNIMVATDVASRGLDFKHIYTVVHWDLSNNICDYMHRTGRTGRAGRDGNSLAYISGYEQILGDLIQMLERNGLEVPDSLRGGGRGGFRGGYRGGSGGGNNWNGGGNSWGNRGGEGGGDWGSSGGGGGQNGGKGSSGGGGGQNGGNWGGGGGDGGDNWGSNGGGEINGNWEGGSGKGSGNWGSGGGNGGYWEGGGGDGGGNWESGGGYGNDFGNSGGHW